MFLLKDFVLVGTGLIIQTDDDLNYYFLEKRNPDNNSGSLIVNDLLFYKNKTNLLRQRLLTNQCKSNSSKSCSLEVPFIPPVIARQALYLSVFSPNAEEYGPEKL